MLSPMKIKLALLFLFLLSLPAAHAQDAKPVPAAAKEAAGDGVKIGDYLWRGVTYYDASVSRSGALIIITSRDGSVKIPEKQAPADLLAKVPAAAPKADAVANPGIFNLLGASEAQLTGKYGTPKPSTGAPYAPATKFLIYDLDDIRYHVHMLNDKSSVLLVSRDTRGLTAGQVAHVLARCGGGWVKEGGGRYHRADGSTATEFKGELSVKSGAFLAASAAQDAAVKR
jgi:hypothetical protein